MDRIGIRRRVATPDPPPTSTTSLRRNHPSWRRSTGSSSSSGHDRRDMPHHSSSTRMNDWIPNPDDVSTGSWRRRIFLIITEPESSALSAAFYVILMSAIFVANIIMVMQTMESWQYTPQNCVTCGGYVWHSSLYYCSRG